MNIQLKDKKECIFKTTLLLIKDQGFHGTPMSQIAKSADVAIGTIYHYFPSKEDLIIELYYDCKRVLHQYIFDPIDSSIPYKEQFALVFKRFCSFYRDHRDTFSFMEQFHNSPYFETVQIKMADGPYEENKLMDFLLRGIEVQSLAKLDVSILSAAFIGVAVSYSKSLIIGKTAFNEKQLDDLVEIIWKGIKK